MKMFMIAWEKPGLFADETSYGFASVDEESIISGSANGIMTPRMHEFVVTAEVGDSWFETTGGIARLKDVPEDATNS